jgi:Na+/H+ antiporter NhaD/arsenite permease-like protein
MALSENLPSLDIIATVIGLASALIDNVPLVAATMGMYDLADWNGRTDLAVNCSLQVREDQS